MKYTLLYLSLIASTCLSMQAAQTAQPSNNNNELPSFNDRSRFYTGADGDIEITPEVLEFLGPQAPEEAKAAFYQFVYQNPGLFEILTKFEPLTWRANHDAAAQALHNKGIVNLSPRKTSFIFPLPTNPNFFVQMSGPYHKLFNLASTPGKGGWNYCNDNYVQGKNLEKLSELTGQATYQTVSRKAFWLAFKKALANIQAKTGQEPKVSTSDTYLLPIVKDSYFPASDRTHVVVQAAYDTQRFAHIRRMNGKDWDKMATAVYAHRANDEAIAQFCDVIGYAKLFDTYPNLLVNCLNGNLHMADLEQPNDESPGEFFHKREPKYANDTWEGFDKFKRIFVDTEQHDKVTVVKNAIKNNKELKIDLSEQSYARIMELAK